MNKMESNPEQSKQLETVTMKILRLDIDFDNPRSEIYSADRVPELRTTFINPPSPLPNLPNSLQCCRGIAESRGVSP